MHIRSYRTSKLFCNCFYSRFPSALSFYCVLPCYCYRYRLSCRTIHNITVVQILAVVATRDKDLSANGAVLTRARVPTLKLQASLVQISIQYFHGACRGLKQWKDYTRHQGTCTCLIQYWNGVVNQPASAHLLPSDYQLRKVLA